VGPDADVQKVVVTIMGVNTTGRAGDGKIMVMPIGDSVRVRTGEAGEAAVS